MPMQSRRIHRLILAPLATAYLATSLAVAGPQTSPIGDDHQVFQQINQLEMACQQRPGDQNLRRRLENARREAAAILADDAHAALRNRMFERALQLAGRAADFDPQFLPMIERFEDEWVDALLARGHLALESNDIEEAEDVLRELERLQPHERSTRLFRAELTVRAGESAAHEALLLAQTGDFIEARNVARRAAEYLPGDPDVMNLRNVIQDMERRSHFNALLSEADLALHNGRLNEAEAMIAELAALQVDDTRLAAFEETVLARRRAFLEWRDLGRVHLQEQRFDDAADAYRRASSVMRDDAIFRTESELAMATVAQQAHMDAASLFLSQGAIAAALVEAEAATGILDSPEARALLDSIRPLHAELALNAALDAGDTAAALNVLNDVTLLDGDPSLREQRARLAERFEQEVRRDAMLAHLNGNTTAALARLQDALTVHPLVSFHDLYKRFESEDLLRRAVEAEKRGDWPLAERLYEEAMKVGAGSEVAGQRLRELNRLTVLEEQNQDLMRERDRLSLDLGSMSDLERRMGRDLRELQGQLNGAHREIDRLRRREADLLRAVRADERHHDDLHRELDDLKCEVTRLCRELEESKREAERWRSRYEKERRRFNRHHGD